MFLWYAEGDSPSKKIKRSLDEAEESHAAATTSYFNELLEAPGELPSSVEDLRRFLSQRLAKLPVDRDIFYAVKQPELVTVSTRAREKKLAAFLEACFFVIKKVPGNEAQSSSDLSFITGNFLQFLDEYVPVDKQIRGLESILDASNPSLSRGTLSALVQLKRPDFQLFVSEVLLLRWENKIRAEDFLLALEENVEKLKEWSPLYYGDLPYVIGGCCGGRLFQWLKLSPRGKEIVAEPISVVYELNKPSGVALFLHSIIRMHCLLRKLQDKLTSRGPAVRIYKAIPRGDDGGLITFYPDFVCKEIVPALSTVRIDELQSLYDAVKGSRYLIQLGGKIRTLCAKTVLKLQPVGDPLATPCDLEQLKNAMHDLLHALEVLHKADYTHRDLRWPNCIRVNVQSEWKWVLIDLEYGGRDGAEWEGDGLVNWDAGTLEDRDGRKVYTKRSDMYELGKLILQWLDSRGESEITLGKRKRSLWRKVRTQGEKMQKERAGAAQMLQEICPKNCARCAKFLA